VKFCSRASIAAHERFAGTGVRAEAYVFLPIPKRLWRESEFNRAWATPEELVIIRGARKTGVVTRLYNPDPEARDAAVAVVYGRDGRIPSGADDYFGLIARRWPIDTAGRPRLAICTHGTRDRCCAKWGFAAYKTARGLYEAGASAFEALECSHLGGDRFAATGIFFPSGDMYAHLDELDLAALATLEAEGRLAPEPYRGRVFDPPLVQVVRAGLAQAGLFERAAAQLEVTPLGPSELEVCAEGRRFRVRVETTQVSFFGSCADAEAGRSSKARRTTFAGAESLDPPTAA